MKVFKFGGASVKTAEAVKNVANIIYNHAHGPLIVVISAMGKTTNALEKLTEAFFEQKEAERLRIFDEIKHFHLDLALELFGNEKHMAFNTIEQSFYHLYYYLKEPPGKNYNFEYDRIVSFGEIISTQIVAHYLANQGIITQWYNAKDLVITDSTYRDARVDWLKTENAISARILPFFKKHEGQAHVVALTQGFIGGTTQGFITTLGREGSDYTAAILAYATRAQDVTIWKDVAGLLNADPKILENTVLLHNISYQEAIELAYYGATVIHPKTLKPLLSRNIPLHVKSFFDPEQVGSIINQCTNKDNQVPSYIFKRNQVLLSIFPKDFSFIAEHNLSRIFSEFARQTVKINLMQNSALSFSVCFDYDKIKTPALLKGLEKLFTVKYNTDAELITIRHYEKAQPENLIQGRKVILEQKSRTTLQWVVK